MTYKINSESLANPNQTKRSKNKVVFLLVKILSTKARLFCVSQVKVF